MGFINIFFGLLRTTSPALERPRVPGNQKQIMSATICSAKGDSYGKTAGQGGEAEGKEKWTRYANGCSSYRSVA